jgi:dTDP-glucose pyrophosphorylase
MNTTLIIMAGGRSSRMKKSAHQLGDHDLASKVKQLHKSLIPLGTSQTPLLSRLCLEAFKAGVTDVIVVTSPENEPFKEWQKSFTKHTHQAANAIHFAVQLTDASSGKPMGTADAIYQAMLQYPKLKNQRFIITNGDNQYSANALSKAVHHTRSPHALIAYEAKSLGYSEERISSFALIRAAHQYVSEIVEKPQVETLDRFKDTEGNLMVSMNLWLADGASFFNALERCPIHPERKEKELPEAFRLAIKDNPSSVFVHLVHETLPDLTSASDLNSFE